MSEGVDVEDAAVEVGSGKDRADENFPVGSVLIRAELRPDVHAYYRFARTADDIADSPDLAEHDKIARLDRMQEVLEGRRDAGSSHALALRAILARRGLEPGLATDLLRAFRQDAVKRRYASWDELYDYCRYSAMPVGRLLLALHGEAPDSFAPSDALCVALQVLNHLQDCAADLAALDRCYLPQDWLDRAGVGVEALRAPRTSAALRLVFDALLDRVDALNRIAATLPGRVRDRRMRLEAAVIVGLAQRLSARLRRADPLAARVGLTRLDFAAAAARAFFW